MSNKKNYKLPTYTVGEEIANSITHGIGALMAIAECTLLIVFAAFTREPMKIVAVSIYGFSLIMLFTMSTLYHALVPERAKAVFRVFDHTSIFLLIAGSYTPITLVCIGGALGWVVFGVVWAATIVGIVLNSISIERFKKFSMICYIATGWCVVSVIVPLVRNMDFAGLMFLVLGGLFYTVGVIFYKKKHIPYMHSVWHVFVLIGATMQFFCTLFYII